MQTTARPLWSSRQDGSTLLIVDDEEGIRDFLRSAFESEGFTVLAAPDGRAAQARRRPA